MLILNRPTALVVVVEQWSLDVSNSSNVFATLGYFVSISLILVYPSHVLREKITPL